MGVAVIVPVFACRPASVVLLQRVDHSHSPTDVGAKRARQVAPPSQNPGTVSTVLEAGCLNVAWCVVRGRYGGEERGGKGGDGWRGWRGS